MSEQKSEANVSTLSNADVTTTSAAASHAIHTRGRTAQNFLLIWADASIDQSTKDCKNMLTQLRSVVNEVNIFTKPDQCIRFLNDVEDEKAFLIVSKYLGQQLVPDIHAMPQLDVIYIFCGNKTRNEQWVKEWPKIKGVHTEISPICEALQLAAKQCNQDSIAVSFVAVSEEASSQNLDQLDSSFMYTQIFKEILLEMKYDQKSIKDLVDYCRKLYINNTYELSIINEFEHNYQSKSVIWWYTRECFTYQMLNRALRTLEADTIINMGFFIRDLHHEIEELHQQQVCSYHEKPFVVYRGQGLSTTDFDKLQKTKGGLMSFNSFLSTSNNREVSLGFAKGALGRIDKAGILFKMSIDPSVSSAPFAFIQKSSYFQKEEEILFSMHTVFRIGEIKRIDNDSPLYQVDLKLTADDDQELRILTKHIREETANETSWDRLSVLLVKIGQFDKAEELFTVLLEQTSDESEKACYYNNLGYIKNNQGIYGKAICHYEKALELNENILPVNHLNLAVSYNNIGSVYHNMGQYSQALLFYKKALEIREKILPRNHLVVATSYNNIGGVYNSMEEFPNALSFYETASELLQQTLPLNHPLHATFYNNIGSVYDNMREYSKALSFYEKALEIREKTLPSNHPVVATSYNNISGVHNSMGEYSKALSFYEKFLQIQENILLPNHPDLANSYHTIGLIYNNMGEYSKALSFYEKALDIRQKTLPAHHPDLASSYNNIGEVYTNMGDYSKALSFNEKALEITAKTLPQNHPDLANSYSNIGAVYNSMGEYPKALSYFERVLDIRQCSLPPNHPYLKDVRKSIENVKKKL